MTNTEDLTLAAPSKSGYTFAPVSISVTISNANQTGKNFTATAVTTTYSISGVVTVNNSTGPVLQGVLVSAAGPQSGSATTDANGAFTLSGLQNGTYTLTPGLTGYTFAPASLSVTLSGANKTGKNFVAAEVYPYPTLTSGTAFTGRVALQAFYYYNITVPSGASSLAITLSNLSADMDLYDQVPGAGIPLTTTGSYNKCSITRGTGNETIPESNPGSGTWILGVYGYQPGTYTITATVTGGGPTYSISGRLTKAGNIALPGLPVQAVLGTATFTATSDSTGNYTISGLGNGTWTVTPDPGGEYTFSPASKPATISNGNVTGLNFVGYLCTQCLAGVVMAPDGTGISGVTIQAESQSGVSDQNGVYVIDGLSKGSHSVHPSADDKKRYLFDPGSRTSTVTGTGPTAHQDFTATPKSGAASGPEEAAPEEPPSGLASGGPSQAAPADLSTTALTRAQLPATVGEMYRQREGSMGPNAREEERGVYSQSGGTSAVPQRTEAQTGSPESLTVLFYYWDHLGTTRMVAGASPTPQNVELHDYEPYGLELPPSTNQAANTHQFTGHERDLGTGIDYMHYRFYGSNMGRFMRPDNVNGTAMNPQSWNLYAYVHGNPVNFNDPTGHAGAAANSRLEQLLNWVMAASDPAPPCGKATANPPPKTTNQAEDPTPAMVVTGAAVQMVAAAVPGNPLSNAGEGALADKLAEASGSSEGSQGLKDTKATLEAGGTLLAEVGLVHASTAVVAAETATQTAIAASGGTAEAVTAGYLGSGLTTATGLGLVGVAGAAGYATGTVINNQLPDTTKEVIGDTMLGMAQTIGLWKDE